MGIFGKVRSSAAESEHDEKDASAPSIVRLGDITELIEGGGNVHADGMERNLFGWR
jgi:hypothetical protein